MGDSPSTDTDSTQSDESLEVQERFDDQRTGNFGGEQTNLSDPSEAQGFAGNTPQERDRTKRRFQRQQAEVREKAFMGGVPGFSERLNPTTQQQQEFARQQNEIDEQGFDPTQEQINVGPGDIFGLRERIAENLRQGGTPSFDPQGNIVGATGFGPAFGGMGILSDVLPDVTTYTGLPSGDPFATNMNMGDDNNEPQIIRTANPREPIDEIEEERPPVSDQLATDFLQNPFFLYSGQGNLFQPYGYAQNTLVDLLRTRNMTQPQQAAANLGLFGNPGDFV